MREQGIKRYIISLAWLLLIVGMAATPVIAASWQWIAPQRVHSMVKEGSGLWLVDVRIASAFDQGHIEGAVNIPADLLKVRNLPKTKIIVLTDDALGLQNARKGAEILLKKGYEKVFILEGGLPAWQAEMLPATGKGQSNLRPVMWDELAWARTNSIRMRLFDLRDKDERIKAPVEEASELKGATLNERLAALKAECRPSVDKGLAGKLEKPLPVVIVLPTASLPLDAVQRALRDLPGDFRYLEGAYPQWAVREKQQPLSELGVCPTCPGGRNKK
jgi:rhodanese-related sulfurtransferase